MGVHLGGVLGLDVGGAVLEPHHVAGRGLLHRGRAGAPEPQLRVTDRRGAAGDAGQVADGVHGDLRVIGAGLDTQVAAAAGRVEGISGEGREVGELVRASAGHCESVDALAVGEQGGAEADGEGQPRRRQVQCFTGVLRWQRRVPRHRSGAHVAGDGHRGSRLGPLLQQLDQVVAARGGAQVEGSKVQPVLRRRRDPGLVGSEERHRHLGLRRGDGFGGPHTGQGDTPGAQSGSGGGAGAQPSQDPSPADRTAPGLDRAG